MATSVQIDDDVDPDIRRFVDALNSGYGQFPGFATLPLPERRAAAEVVRAPWRKGGPAMHRTVNVRVGETALRLHIPSDAQTAPAMLYIHGGGWTMFSIETHDRLMREYAARAGVIVAGIDYTRSPEVKFPHALNEVVAAFDWLRSEGAEHGVDPERIAVGGDSAGANLSVAAALMLRQRGGAMPSAMLLNYGAFESRPGDASYARYDGPNYMLTVEEMAVFWKNYLTDPAAPVDPLAAPLRADLHGLPPAFLAIAECDILADGNHALAARLKNAGVEVDARLYEGATHSFLEAMSIAPLADRALAEASDWLRAKLDA